MNTITKYTSTDKGLSIPRYAERTAAIYIRVSSDEQVDNFSIPTQIKDCRKYLDREKIKEIGIFVEEGESAKQLDVLNYKTYYIL